MNSKTTRNAHRLTWWRLRTSEGTHLRLLFSSSTSSTRVLYVPPSRGTLINTPYDNSPFATVQNYTQLHCKLHWASTVISTSVCHGIVVSAVASPALPPRKIQNTHTQLQSAALFFRASLVFPRSQIFTTFENLSLLPGYAWPGPSYANRTPKALQFRTSLPNFTSPCSEKPTSKFFFSSERRLVGYLTYMAQSPPSEPQHTTMNGTVRFRRRRLRSFSNAHVSLRRVQLRI